MSLGRDTSLGRAGGTKSLVASSEEVDSATGLFPRGKMVEDEGYYSMRPIPPSVPCPYGEIRSTNFEIRNKPEIIMTKTNLGDAIKPGCGRS